MYTRWNTYSSYLKKRHGKSLYRIGVDGGFSCPNRRADKSGGCAFCDGTGSVAVYQRKAESGYRRLSEFLIRRYKAESFALCFQSYTNTYDSVENLRRIYDEALSVMDFGEFIVSTRPDAVPEEVLSLLASYRKNMDVWVEYGLQSADDDTLRYINRGHDTACYLDAVKRAHEHGILVSTHIILGLPGEGRDSFIRSAELLNEAGTDAVKIHNLHITGGTELADEYLDGVITTMSEERTLEATELFLRHLSPDIIVERLISETPYHRLIAPRVFPDKSKFLSHLEKRMIENDTRQGDCCEKC